MIQNFSLFINFLLNKSQPKGLDTFNDLFIILLNVICFCILGIAAYYLFRIPRYSEVEIPFIEDSDEEIESPTSGLEIDQIKAHNENIPNARNEELNGNIRDAENRRNLPTSSSIIPSNNNLPTRTNMLAKRLEPIRSEQEALNRDLEGNSLDPLSNQALEVYLKEQRNIAREMKKRVNSLLDITLLLKRVRATLNTQFDIFENLQTQIKNEEHLFYSSSSGFFRSGQLDKIHSMADRMITILNEMIMLIQTQK
jgi:hypothetical protein